MCAVVAAVVGGGQLVRAQVLIIAVAFSCAALAAILTLLVTPMLVLHHYRQATEASVVAQRRVGDEYRYLLLAANGEPISSELSERRDVFDPDDQVDVVFDPGGRLKPAYADQMDDAGTLLAAAAVGCQVVPTAKVISANRWSIARSTGIRSNTPTRFLAYHSDTTSCASRIMERDFDAEASF